MIRDPDHPDFDPSPDELAELTSPGAPLRHRLEWGSVPVHQLGAVSHPEPLIAGLLQRQTTAMLFGPTGVGKTFVAADLALHLASSTHWHGHAIPQPGGVIYIAAEGIAGMHKRAAAWARHNRTELGSRHYVDFFPDAINLHRAADVQDFIRYAAAMHPALIVVDTLARCMVGADENSSRDMGIVVANVDRIRRTTGACVLIIHHTGHEGGRARGSSALKAALDTELELAATATGLALRTTKQKDEAPADTIHLELVRAANSLAVAAIGQPRLPTIDRLPAHLRATLDALRSIAIAGGVTAGEWHEATTDVPQRTFYNHRKELLDARLVLNVGTDKAPRYLLPSATATTLVATTAAQGATDER